MQDHIFSAEAAALWGWRRAVRLFDGPDDVHLATLARAELGQKPVFDL